MKKSIKKIKQNAKHSRCAAKGKYLCDPVFFPSRFKYMLLIYELINAYKTETNLLKIVTEQKKKMLKATYMLCMQSAMIRVRLKGGLVFGVKNVTCCRSTASSNAAPALCSKNVYIFNFLFFHFVIVH